MTLEKVSRRMVEKSPQTLGKVLGAQCHASQHPFHDVAVVAEQSSRLAGVVAMIGSNLLAFLKGARANSAFVLLNNEEAVNVPIAKASPAAALGVKPLGPFDGIGLNGGVSRLSISLSFWRSIECLALRCCFGRVSSLFALGFDFGALRSRSLLGANPLNVVPIILAVKRKIRRPFLRCAFGFSFFHVDRRTRHSTSLNHAVT